MKTIYVVFCCGYYEGEQDELVQAFSNEDAANAYIKEQNNHRYYTKETQLKISYKDVIMDLI
jgi:hypothetical protein